MRTLPAFLLLAAALPASASDLSGCLVGMRPQALAQGISAKTFDTHTTGLATDPSVLEALDYQPEFRTPIWDYLAGLVDEERVSDGQAMLAEHAAILAKVERDHGV